MYLLAGVHPVAKVEGREAGPSTKTCHRFQLQEVLPRSPGHWYPSLPSTLPFTQGPWHYSVEMGWKCVPGVLRLIVVYYYSVVNT